MFIATINGNVVHEAEIRQVETKNGTKSAVTFSVAVDTNGRNKETKGFVTDFVNVTMWGDRGVNVAKMIKKGIEVTIWGQMSMVPYKNKDGVEKVSLQMDGDYIRVAPAPKSREDDIDNLLA